MMMLKEWRARRKLARYRKAVKTKTVRSGPELDREVSEYFSSQLGPRPAPKLQSRRIAVLASALADVGGHTICVKRFVESFHSEYELGLFLSDADSFTANAPATAGHLGSMVEILGVSQRAAKKAPLASISELYQQIIDFAPCEIFVYIGMNDVVAAAALALIHRDAPIKIIYFNHGDQLYSLGIASSDLVAGPRPYALETLKSARGELDYCVLPLQGVKESELVFYNAEEIRSMREAQGVDRTGYLTLTGCASGKLFEQNGSAYLEMIRDLLEAEPALVHLLLTELSENQESILRSVFYGKEKLLERLRIQKRVHDFDQVLQSVDLFIDSFPVGSALVHIDMMRSKRPTVIKINNEEPLFSFEEYQYPDYQFAFASVDSMRAGILRLLRDRAEQERVIEKSFRHFLASNEFSAVKSQYQALIENMRE